MSQPPMFRSLDSIAKTIVFSLKAIIVCYIGISLIDTAGGLAFPTFSDPKAELSSQGELSLLKLQFGAAMVGVLLTLVAAVSICRFMHRANTNLRVKGVTGLEYTPGWCIGWWFIPIANLFQPRNAMAELYRASSRPTEADWRYTQLPQAMNTWWACWVAGSIISRLENRLAAQTDLGMAAIPLSWLSTGILVGAAFYLIKVVSDIRDLQNRNVADLVLPASH